MRRVALLAVTAILVAACGGRVAAPSTPRPSFVPDAVATAEREGVRVTLSLDRRRLAPGEVAWADVRVENTNPTSVWWLGGGCNVPATVTASLATSGYGRLWTEPDVAHWKKVWMQPYVSPAAFVPEQAWADFQKSGGGPACTADVRYEELKRGGVLTLRAAWDGTGTGPSGRFPAAGGTSAVTAAFPITFAPPPPGQFSNMAGKLPITASATIELTGRPSIVPAGEALDAALDDPRFRAWIAERVAEERAGWPNAQLGGGLHLAGDRWYIRVSQKAPQVREAEAVVNATTGAVTLVRLDPR